MSKNPNGRPPKIDYGTLKRLYDEFKKRNPTGSKKEFAQEVGLSDSRARKILNTPMDEIRRKKPDSGAESEGTQEQTKEEVDEPKKRKDLIFYNPWG